MMSTFALPQVVFYRCNCGTACSHCSGCVCRPVQLQALQHTATLAIVVHIDHVLEGCAGEALALTSCDRLVSCLLRIARH